MAGYRISLKGSVSLALILALARSSIRRKLRRKSLLVR